MPQDCRASGLLVSGGEARDRVGEGTQLVVVLEVVTPARRERFLPVQCPCIRPTIEATVSESWPPLAAVTSISSGSSRKRSKHHSALGRLSMMNAPL